MSDYQSMTYDQLREIRRSPIPTTDCPECGALAGNPCVDRERLVRSTSGIWWHTARRDKQLQNKIAAMRARDAREDFGDR